MQGYTHPQQQQLHHGGGGAGGYGSTPLQGSTGPAVTATPGVSGQALSIAGRRALATQSARRMPQPVGTGPGRAPGGYQDGAQEDDDQFHRGGLGAGARGQTYYQGESYGHPLQSTATFAPVAGPSRPPPVAQIKSEPHDARFPPAAPADYEPYAGYPSASPARQSLQAGSYSRSVPHAQPYMSPHARGPPSLQQQQQQQQYSDSPTSASSPAAVSRIPAPSVEGLMGHFARTDELALVRARCRQVNDARSRGVYPPEDSRAGQAYPLEERLHLARQIQQCRDREMVIIEECEAFFRAHGGQDHVLRCAEQYIRYRQQQQQQQARANHEAASRYSAPGASSSLPPPPPSHKDRHSQQLRIDTYAAEALPPQAGPSSARQIRPPPPQQQQRNQAYDSNPAYEAHPRSAPPTQQHFPSSSIASRAAGAPPPPAASERPAFRTAQSFHQIQRVPLTSTLHQQQHQNAHSFHQHPQRHPPGPSQAATAPFPPSSARDASNVGGNTGRPAIEPSRFQANSYTDSDMSAFGITQARSPGQALHATTTGSPTTYPTDIPSVLHAQLDAARRQRAEQQQQHQQQQAGLPNGTGGQVLVAGGPAYERVERELPTARSPRSSQQQRGTPLQGGPAPGTQQSRSPRHPTQILAEGGGLAELQAQIAPHHFFGMLSQALSRRSEGPPPERCFVGSFQVDLFQLSQIVIGRCAGYAKVDHDNAWHRVAATLLPSSVNAPETMRVPSQLRDLYMHYVAPYEDDWSSEMLRRRNQQRSEPSPTVPARPVAALPSKPRSRPPSRLGGPVQFAPISTPATHAPIVSSDHRSHPAPGSTPSDHASQGGSGSAAPSPTSPRSRGSTISTASSMFASAFGGFSLGPTTAITTDTSSVPFSAAPSTSLQSQAQQQQQHNVLTPAEERDLADILAQVDAHEQAMEMQAASTTTTPVEVTATLSPSSAAAPAQSPRTAPSPGAAALAAATAAGHVAPFSSTSNTSQTQRTRAGSLHVAESRPMLQRAVSDSSVHQSGSEDPITRPKRTRDVETSRERVGDEERRKRESTGQFSPRKSRSTGQCSAESTPDLVPSGSRRPGTSSTGSGSLVSPLVMSKALPDESPSMFSVASPHKTAAEVRSPAADGTLAIPNGTDVPFSTPSPTTLGAVSDFDLLSLTTPIKTEFPTDAFLPPSASSAPSGGGGPSGDWASSYDLFPSENGLDLPVNGANGAEQVDLRMLNDYSIDCDSYRPILSPDLNRSVDKFRNSDNNGGGGGHAAPGPGDPNGDEYWHPSSLLDFEFVADFAT
ncbi:hypothetical protein JCM10908_003653 [Rhodotorula pacifica]|uniref:uncharacterized protein n=1 Tax=Rhodotorula pacifica TaxID=1495444 RepID=UPI00316F39DE